MNRDLGSSCRLEVNVQTDSAGSASPVSIHRDSNGKEDGGNTTRMLKDQRSSQYGAGTENNFSPSPSKLKTEESLTNHLNLNDSNVKVSTYRRKNEAKQIEVKKFSKNSFMMMKPLRSSNPEHQLRYSRVLQTTTNQQHVHKMLNQGN